MSWRAREPMKHHTSETARDRVWSRCAAVSVALALGLAPLPAGALASPPPIDEEGVEAPEPVEAEPVEAEEPGEVEVEPEDPAEADEPLEPGEAEADADEPLEPGEADADEPLEPGLEAPEAPEAELDPVEAIPDTMVEPVIDEAALPRPDPRRVRRMYLAGLGLTATGGAITATGLGLAITYTILGDREEDEADPDFAQVRRMATISQAGGVLIASGLAFAAVGGVILARTRAKMLQLEGRRVFLTPTIGGVVLSGRF